MYRITITRLVGGTDLANPTEKDSVEVYSQSFDELNIPATIALLNKQPRARGPRKNKAAAK